MIQFSIADLAAGMGALPRRNPCPEPADPVRVIARAMLELEAEGQTVDAAALQIRTRLSRHHIDELADAARERAYAMQRRQSAPRIRVPAQAEG